MDISTISQVVGSLGFPIVACVYMAYVNHKQTEAHREEMVTMTGAITELKVAITQLSERLRKDED